MKAPEEAAAVCEGGLSFRFDFDETPTTDELQSALSGLGASEKPY